METNRLDGIVKEKKYSYLLGLLGALIGAFIGAIPWAIVYYFGWFVGWLGYLIGFCAVGGYKIACKKTGWPTFFIAIFAVIFGVVAGQVLGDFITIGTWIANGEVSSMYTYADIPAMYMLVLEDSEVMTEVLVSLGIGLLFAGAGAWRIVGSVISDFRNKNKNGEDTTEIAQSDAEVIEVAAVEQGAEEVAEL